MMVPRSVYQAMTSWTRSFGLVATVLSGLLAQLLYHENVSLNILFCISIGGASAACLVGVFTFPSRPLPDVLRIQGPVIDSKLSVPEEEPSAPSPPQSRWSSFVRLCKVFCDDFRACFFFSNAPLMR